MSDKILIVDYGMGNLNSVKRKLDRCKVNSIISSDPSEILKADKIILPGVGHFAKAMQHIQAMNLLEPLNDFVMIRKKPILGICLGMQLMAKRSEEGNVNGFGWIDADVVRFRVNNTLKYKIPHVGWNQINIRKDSVLMKDIPELSEFYFIHSYHLVAKDQKDVLNETEYESRFISAIEKGNIFGVQYHPEKSHDMGELLLKNFIEL